MFCWDVNRKTSFGPQNGPKIDPKTVPNRVQNGFGRVLNADRNSRLKKKLAGSSDGAGAGFKLERLDPVWGGKTGRGHNCLHTPNDPQRGLGGYEWIPFVSAKEKLPPTPPGKIS